MNRMIKSTKMRIMNVLHYILTTAVTLGSFQAVYFPHLSQVTYRTVFVSCAIFYIIEKSA